MIHDRRSQRSSRRRDFVIFLEIILCRVLLKEKVRESFNVRDRQLFKLEHEVDLLSFLYISLISSECCEITINFVRKNDFFSLNFTISLDSSHSSSLVFFSLRIFVLFNCLLVHYNFNNNSNLSNLINRRLLRS